MKSGSSYKKLIWRGWLSNNSVDKEELCGSLVDVGIDSLDSGLAAPVMDHLNIHV